MIHMGKNQSGRITLHQSFQLPPVGEIVKVEGLGQCQIMKYNLSSGKHSSWITIKVLGWKPWRLYNSKGEFVRTQSLLDRTDIYPFTHRKEKDG